MATVRIILGIICLVIFGQFIKFSGRFLKTTMGVLAKPVQSQALNTVKYRPTMPWPKEKAPFKLINNLSKSTVLLNVARNALGVREATGHNDGQAVESYLQYVGQKKGVPWCAAFVSWVFGQTGYAQPRTAWSPALFPKDKRTPPKLGAVFGLYFPNLGRIAHCGLVEQINGHWLITIEGNTNIEGSREGDGVYRKRRAIRAVRYFADWIGH